MDSLNMNSTQLSLLLLMFLFATFKPSKAFFLASLCLFVAQFENMAILVTYGQKRAELSGFAALSYGNLLSRTFYGLCALFQSIGILPLLVRGLKMWCKSTTAVDYLPEFEARVLLWNKILSQTYTPLFFDVPRPRWIGVAIMQAKHSIILLAVALVASALCYSYEHRRPKPIDPMVTLEGAMHALSTRVVQSEQRLQQRFDSMQQNVCQAIISTPAPAEYGKLLEMFTSLTTLVESLSTSTAEVKQTIQRATHDLANDPDISSIHARLDALEERLSKLAAGSDQVQLIPTILESVTDVAGWVHDQRTLNDVCRNCRKRGHLAEDCILCGECGNKERQGCTRRCTVQRFQKEGPQTKDGAAAQAGPSDSTA